MSTNAQIAANRQNSQSSTGPVTEEGKAASSQNSLRHGLSGSALIMLPHENPEAFIEFANNLRAEHKPLTVTEDALVAKMAQSQWLSTRAVNLQSMILAESLHPDQQLLALYIRYQSLHERVFSKSLAELQKLRKEASEKETREQEIGFVSQTRQQELHAAKIRVLNARSEACETITQARKLRNSPLSEAAPSAKTATMPRKNGQKSAA